MERKRQGTLSRQTIHLESFNAFVPFRLPPDPPLDLKGDLGCDLSLADQMLGRLDGLSLILPQPDLLIDFYIRKEAVLSSQIEGTQSTITDLLLFELEPEDGNEDAREVSNYVVALRHGVQRLGRDFPLSLRLIKEIHGILLQSGRGSRHTPGEFRASQSWIGGTRPGNAFFVPPPVYEMHQALGEMELFLHSGAEQYPALVQCALLHVQFETIHPFLDGNGRIGRLLITLLLIDRKVLRKPLLYMSLYLKQNRDEYYDLLQRVRMEGCWEEWVGFFLRGVSSTAEKAVTLATDVLELFRRHEQLIRQSGARRGSALQVQQLQKTPYSSPSRLAARTELSFNTVVAALDILQELGVVAEMPPRRGRLVSYAPYLDLLDEGTLPV
jgi:Fic family protein